jgi:hypothetical protein
VDERLDVIFRRARRLDRRVDDLGRDAREFQRKRQTLISPLTTWPVLPSFDKNAAEWRRKSLAELVSMARRPRIGRRRGRPYNPNSKRNQTTLG